MRLDARLAPIKLYRPVIRGESLEHVLHRQPLRPVTLNYQAMAFNRDIDLGPLGEAELFQHWL